MSSPIQVSVRTQIDDELTREIALLVERVAESDGVRPLSEHVVLQVLSGQSDHFMHLYARLDSRLVGYAGIDLESPGIGAVMELAVDPRARTTGVGEALMNQALSQVSGRLSVWAHGTHSFATSLALARDFTPVRELQQMHRNLVDQLPEPPQLAGVTIRAFEPGVDEEEWLRLNAAAFVDLPDQGSWTLHDLALREAEDWFDPTGFFIAIDDETGRMIGFHWTKIHQHDQNPVGEIYVIGIDPQTAQRGLGRALSITGMRYLQSRGLAEVILYVDAANTAARKLYDRLGFVTYNTDVLYRSPASTS